MSAGGSEYVCRARGALRTKDITPLCGDSVEIEQSGGEAVISKIFPRKNEIVRPPLANLDRLVFVLSTVDPVPNLRLLDKFTAVAVYKGISPVIVFTKTDRCGSEEYEDIYRGIFPVFSVNNITGEGVSELCDEIKGGFSALAGNSGVGKSSLLNRLCPEACAQTGEISRKLRRGKNTTRRTDIHTLPGGGYIADTPGFAAFSTERYDTIFKEELAGCFPEFEEYIGRCRFPDCSHTKEQGCAVLEALASGKIKKPRHLSYCEMYEEALKIRPWEVKDTRR